MIKSNNRAHINKKNSIIYNKSYTLYPKMYNGNSPK